MHGRPNRRNKAEVSNSFGVLWTGPKTYLHVYQGMKDIMMIMKIT